MFLIHASSMSKCNVAVLVLAIEGAENARCDYEDALKHGGFDVGANGSFWDSTRRGILAI